MKYTRNPRTTGVYKVIRTGETYHRPRRVQPSSYEVAADRRITESLLVIGGLIAGWVIAACGA